MDTRSETPLLVRGTHALEAASALDPPARAVRALADRLVASPRSRGLLGGTWLGHALHATLTDLPLGAWTSASILDAVGGRESRRAATVLIGVGLAAAVPTALTGVAEWAMTTDRRVDRVALVHAVVNDGAVVLYGASLLARLRGRTRRGQVLAAAGAASAGAGGYLGGHLTVARKVGSHDPSFDA